MLARSASFSSLFALVASLALVSTARAQADCSSFLVADTTHQEISFGVAYDGANFLAALAGTGGTGPFAGAQLLSPAGTRIGSPISVAANVVSGPGVAFGGGTYVLGWVEQTATWTVRGMLVSPAGTAGAPFVISPANAAQVDGAGIASDGSGFLAAYFRKDPTNRRVFGRLVSAGGVVGAEFPISTNFGSQGFNCVAYGGGTYLVVWVEDVNRLEVRGRLVSTTGVLGTEFAVNSSAFSSNSSVSVGFNGTNFLVSWSDLVSAANMDLFAQIVSPAGVLQGGLITLAGAAGYQGGPQISADGSNWLVTWSDFRNDVNANFACDAGEGTCADVYGRFVTPGGGTLGAEFPLRVASGDQTISPVAFGAGKHLVEWTEGNFFLAAPTLGDVVGTFVMIGGCPSTTPLCAGDGTTATPCPCGNSGGVGRGCQNSGSTGGALLVSAGSIEPDALVLTSSSEMPTAPSIFLQGNALVAAGAVFGDGIRCAGGVLKRLGVKTAVGGTVVYPQAGDPGIRARSAALGDTIPNGSVRWYQVYYRDPDPLFCPIPTGNTWNASNGIAVTWP